MFLKIALFGDFLKGFNFLSAFLAREHRNEACPLFHNQDGYAYCNGLMIDGCKAGREARQ